MNCLIHFRFKGTFHKKWLKSCVYCWVDGVSSDDDKDWLKQQASETLGCMINGGLVDFECTHAVDNFELISCDYTVPYNKGVSTGRSMFGMRHCYQPKML